MSRTRTPSRSHRRLTDRIALAIGEVRIGSGVSQTELARRSGVGSKTISSYETRERAPGMKVWQLIAIADALETTPAALIELATQQEIA